MSALPYDLRRCTEDLVADLGNRMMQGEQIGPTIYLFIIGKEHRINIVRTDLDKVDGPIAEALVLGITQAIGQEFEADAAMVTAEAWMIPGDKGQVDEQLRLHGSPSKCPGRKPALMCALETRTFGQWVATVPIDDQGGMRRLGNLHWKRTEHEEPLILT